MGASAALGFLPSAPRSPGEPGEGATWEERAPAIAAAGGRWRWRPGCRSGAPPIHAEVGDTVKVVFRNNTPFPASMHPHGVFYDKGSEGADYDDGTSGADKADDAVPEGGEHTYTWEVPERAGPTSHDESSVLWAYHSHTDEITDTNAGLIGPIIVTRKGM